MAGVPVQTLPKKALAFLEEFENMRRFKITTMFLRFLKLPYSTIAFFTGNRYGKTACVAYQYVMRIMGWHPIPHRNVMYFECPNHMDERHGWHLLEYPDTGQRIKLCRKGLYTDAAFHPPGLPWLFRRPKDNLCTICGEHLQIHERRSGCVFRFCSETLPVDAEMTGSKKSGADVGESTEVKNTIYPAFKNFLPKSLIKADIKRVRPAMTILDPNRGLEYGDLKYKGRNIVAEFVSYNQQVQATAGVARMSIWTDEEPPFDFYEEQKPRLISEDGEGDFVFTLTPAEGMSWAYDEIFQRAGLYLRTPAISAFLKKQEGRQNVGLVEFTDSGEDIVVIQAATDDNPILPREAIEKIFNFDDPDTIATRRFGIFKQATGRIFVDVEYQVHGINPEKYFMHGEFPSRFTYFRAIDFHERNPWAILWVALSPENEAFAWQEWSPSPAQWVNISIGQEMASRSAMKKFTMNLIDPLANKIQTNTGITVVEDLNRIFHTMKHDGTCMGGYWEPYDTKGLKGRDEIKKRLRNSLLVGKPFNNKVVRDGLTVGLPTLWIFRECREIMKSLKNWRYEEWTSRMSTVKDKKERPTQKFSHYCTALEGLMKDQRFRPMVGRGTSGPVRKDRRFQPEKMAARGGRRR